MRGKNGHTKPPPLTNPLTHDLEVRTAERDAALDALEGLLASMGRENEFATFATQQAIGRAKTVLAEQGRRSKSPFPVWTNRR